MSDFTPLGQLGRRAHEQVSSDTKCDVQTAHKCNIHFCHTNLCSQQGDTNLSSQLTKLKWQPGLLVPMLGMSTLYLLKKHKSGLSEMRQTDFGDCRLPISGSPKAANIPRFSILPPHIEIGLSPCKPARP